MLKRIFMKKCPEEAILTSICWAMGDVYFRVLLEGRKVRKGEVFEVFNLILQRANFYTNHNQNVRLSKAIIAIDSAAERDSQEVLDLFRAFAAAISPYGFDVPRDKRLLLRMWLLENHGVNLN